MFTCSTLNSCCCGLCFLIECPVDFFLGGGYKAVTWRAVDCKFCTQIMSYKPSFHEGSVFFFSFQTGSKAAGLVSVPEASPGGLRQMEHFIAAAFQVISVS